MNEAPPIVAEQISYEDLYRRWEQQNWQATAIDFSSDREQWHERLSDIERRAALWNYALFFHGEDAVADNLSPYIDAAPREEQKYFLTTQQVDEARHAVFFGRFMREVVDYGGDFHGLLERTRPELTWGFRKTFELLDDVANRLRRDRSRPQLAAAICLYHLVIEGTLAQTGQHFIEDYLTERQLLPGFREGMGNVARDEQRHIAFGVRMLYDLQREDPDCRHAVAEMLREVLPFSAAVFVPPGWDRRYTEVFGRTIEEIFAIGATSLEQKLRAAGMPVEELPGPPVMPLGLSAEERARRAIKLIQAGVLGEPNGPPRRDPETMELLFDMVARTLDPRAANGGLVVQWDFRDAEPWFIRIVDGRAEPQRGRVENPDVTLAVSYDDWVDVVAGRNDPRKLFLRGRLRPRGRIRSLVRLARSLGR
ncbi:ribonucleotide-diphosphate reductase subunit beta [Thermoleophilum album]|uniref:p-aminobenzoate N-oxygenase AurF n=1 Tax=Thermoleophilum album TaxID=29539 RepID=A0A1H6FMP7_THEAL|nr:ribonucleotide-diphosphate reductase subunit beta [Thermoleophilum album]SEH11632.1 P-aminobenzoate N-oxygenase AurF [Thermoleophilum album]